MSLIWKLLALIAVLLMPFGMAGASAHPQQHHQAMANMTHCPDQGARHEVTSGLADCTMACASALPAADAPNALVTPAKALLSAPSLDVRLHGLHPETAKPPPRVS